MDDLSPIIVAFGIPCLDYVVRVPDTKLLDKYGLLYDSQCNVKDKELEEIKEEIKKNGYESVSCAGGCAQNSLRIFQWLLDEPYRKTVMFGPVGQDEEATILENQVERAGVITKYTKLANAKTNYVVIISQNGCRSTAGNLDAFITNAHYTLDPEYAIIVEPSKIIHLDAFFAFCCPDISTRLIQEYKETKITSFNMGAAFLLKTKPEPNIALCKMCDIVFGNKVEFKVIADLLNLTQSNMSELLISFHKIMLLHATEKFKWVKILVVTDGDNPVYCVHGKDSNVEIYSVPKIDSESVVDTTGAGDAFIAGFLYGILYKKDVTAALEIGCKAAKDIIKEHGVAIPSKKPPTTEN